MTTLRDDDSRFRSATVGRLRRKAVVAGAAQVGICLAWVGAAAPRSGGAWLAGALLVTAYFAAFLVRHASENELVAGAGLSARWGAGTAVTVGRLSCLSLLAGYVVSPPAAAALWLVAGLYAAVAAGDWLDGFLARRTGHETRLGARLDQQVDIAGLAVASVVAVVAGRLPVWYLGLGFAAVGFHAGLAARRAAGLEGGMARLRPSVHTRAFAGFQMALVAVALVPRLDAGVVHVVATVFMVPSLAAFVRDWFVATGRLAPETVRYAQVTRWAVVGARGVLPVLLRPGFAALAVWAVPGEAAGVFWMTIVCAGAFLAGVVPRLVAAGWLVTVGLWPAGTLPEPVLVAVAASVLMLGSGWWSLYQPEERWFFGRHGRRRPPTAVTHPGQA